VLRQRYAGRVIGQIHTMTIRSVIVGHDGEMEAAAEEVAEVAL